jgi:site-specific recombinase XerD
MKTRTTPPTWREALEFFLGEYLPRHQGAAARTCETYGESLGRLLEGIDRTHARPHMVTPSAVLSALERLERRRGNSVSTRNLRLAAFRAFCKALALWDPKRRDRYELLRQVPFKRALRRSPDYLDGPELAGLLSTVDARSRHGFRDRTMLLWFYNTGARLSEGIGLRRDDLRLDRSPQVTVRGKGGRVRTCPLWTTTAEMLRLYLRSERGTPRPGHAEHVFLTGRGTCFTRRGLWKRIRLYLDRAVRVLPSLKGKRLTPHSLRHTTAVHMLQAGVEINAIKAWLGHADVQTTSRYLELSVDAKRQVLERFGGLDLARLLGDSLTARSPLPKGLLDWLEKL